MLEPFAKWVDYFQVQKYPTVAEAHPCLNELIHHLEELSNGGILADLCEAIKEEIKFRFSYVLSINDATLNPTYIMATAVHPTLALTMENSEIQKAREELLIVLKKQANENSAISIQESLSNKTEEQKSLSERLFPHLKQKIQQAKAVGISAVPAVEEEVNSYFKQLPSYPEVLDPLKFWMDNQGRFPALSHLACDILAIPASSAAVESAFSISGHASSGRRHNLSMNLEKEVMLKVNKRFL